MVVVPRRRIVVAHCRGTVALGLFGLFALRLDDVGVIELFIFVMARLRRQQRQTHVHRNRR